MKILALRILCVGLLVLLIINILFGIYASIWLMFIGGIVDIINAAKLSEVDSFAIAIGIAKIVFCAFPSLCSAFVSAILAKLIDETRMF